MLTPAFAGQNYPAIFSGVANGTATIAVSKYTDKPFRKVPKFEQPFIGRNVEVVELLKKLYPPSSESAGLARVVNLYGDDGIGKSTLMRAAASYAVGRSPGHVETVLYLDMREHRDPKAIMYQLTEVR